MRAWIIVGFVGLLAGCMSASNKLDRELRPFVGQNITALSAVLGDPQSMDTVGGEYIWQVDNRFVITQPKIAMNPGDLSRMPSLPATGSTENVAMHYVCNLQVLTDLTGIIESSHAKGNEGCQRFVTALEM